MLTTVFQHRAGQCTYFDFQLFRFSLIYPIPLNLKASFLVCRRYLRIGKNTFLFNILSKKSG